MSTEQSATPGGSAYVLGHADVEVQRLLLQARLYNDDTEHALRRAGLRPGMRVLDVGCGPGDVSFLAARLVGPTGTVLGVDVAAEIIELARARAAERGLSWVRFEKTTIADIALDEPVDAVVGRLILMHLPDPVSALRQFAGLMRRGGLIAFCETDIGAVRSIPDTPQFRAVTKGIVSAFRALGLDPEFGTTLHSLFQRAGLPVPRLALAAGGRGKRHRYLRLRDGGVALDAAGGRTTGADHRRASRHRRPLAPVAGGSRRSGRGRHDAADDHRMVSSAVRVPALLVERPWSAAVPQPLHWSVSGNMIC